MISIYNHIWFVFISYMYFVTNICILNLYFVHLDSHVALIRRFPLHSSSQLCLRIPTIKRRHTLLYFTFSKSLTQTNANRKIQTLESFWKNVSMHLLPSSLPPFWAIWHSMLRSFYILTFFSTDLKLPENEASDQHILIQFVIQRICICINCKL